MADKRVCPTCQKAKDEFDCPPRGECYKCKRERESRRYWANPEEKRVAERERYYASKTPCPVCSDLKKPESKMCDACSRALRYYDD